jgi:hypothetical protein
MNSQSTPEAKQPTQASLSGAAALMYEALIAIRKADDDIRQTGLRSMQTQARNILEKAIAQAEQSDHQSQQRLTIAKMNARLIAHNSPD